MGEDRKNMEQVSGEIRAALNKVVLRKTEPDKIHTAVNEAKNTLAKFVKNVQALQAGPPQSQRPV